MEHVSRSSNEMLNQNVQTDHLEDTHHRQVNYLRVSVTDQCNLACCYCAPSRPKPVHLTPGVQGLISFDQMERAIKIGVELGITKVRLTGGEPLCRKGITDFIGKISNIAGIRDIGLTTNGIMFESMAGSLQAAGLGRVNISLDTLVPEKFKKITGKDAWQKAWDSIMAAIALGFAPVKINTVVMRGINDDEIEALARLSLEYPVHVRFIEYMPIGTDPCAFKGYFISGKELRARLTRTGTLIPVVRQACDGPASRYKFQGAPGEVGFISSMSDHFCSRCNRMRLTSKGYLRPCLLADDQVRLAEALAPESPDEQIRTLFFKALAMKKKEHGLNFDGHGELKSRMVQIGG